MANVNGVLQVKMRGQRRQVIGIVIHVVTVAHLSGPAMASAVMRYDAIAVLEEEQHLRVPVIGRQRPAMAEHNGLTFTPVLIVDLRPVFGCNCTHLTTSLPVLLPPGIVSKRRDSSYRSGRSPDWIKSKNPACAAREAGGRGGLGPLMQQREFANLTASDTNMSTRPPSPSGNGSRTRLVRP
jgi:hypothetical protein